MDWDGLKEKGLEYFRRYRYALLVLSLGLLLMLLPGGAEEPTAVPLPQKEEALLLQDRLSALLSRVEGAGKVQVLLTEASGQETYYQADEDRNSSENDLTLHRDTVVITGQDREESGLVRRVDPPVYLGAVVLSQGADRPAVRLALVEAVKSATGLSADRITVLKMK